MLWLTERLQRLLLCAELHEQAANQEPVWYKISVLVSKDQKLNLNNVFKCLFQKATSTDTYAPGVSFPVPHCFSLVVLHNNLTKITFFGHTLSRISVRSLLTQALVMPATNLPRAKNPQMIFSKFMIWSKIAAAKLWILTDVCFLGSLKAARDCQFHFSSFKKSHNTNKWICYLEAGVVSHFAFAEMRLHAAGIEKKFILNNACL